jgi:hypothetical protein
VGIVTDSDELRATVEQFSSFLAGETLATKIVFEVLPGVEPKEIEVGDATAKLTLRVVK